MTEPNNDESVKQKIEAYQATDPSTAKCVFCRKPVYGIMHDHAVVPGHIYSEAGIREYGISGMCEYCFDEATLPEDED